MKNKIRIILLCLGLALGTAACSSKEPAKDSAVKEENTSKDDNAQKDQQKTEPSDKNDSASDNKEDSSGEPDGENENNDPQKPDDQNGQNQESEDVKIQTMEEVAAEGQKNIVIYYSNDNADGLDQTEITMAQLTPEALMEELVKKGVVSGDIEVISCKEVAADDKKNMDLDLSKSFETYLNSMGSAGERMAIESLCNTYLKAYGCEKVRITVEGRQLSTGHAEYPGYIGFFDK